jgi:AcrR family transcriptional regulator
VGRVAQRRRTREAIIEATARLLQEGATPSVNDVARAAEMSRRTIYQYFPTLEQLLIDASLARLAQSSVDEAIEAAEGHGTAQERVARMVRALADMSTQTLALGRSLIRLTVEAPPRGGPAMPRRGYRRVRWIERALEPLRTELDAAAFERLVSALAMVVGWEALVVLEDVRGLGRAEQLETQLWAARSLIEAALAERS